MGVIKLHLLFSKLDSLLVPLHITGRMIISIALPLKKALHVFSSGFLLI